MDVCFIVPLKEGGVLSVKKKLISAVNSDTLLKMRRGVVTLRSVQYGEYRLSVLNDRREFMQIILTNSDPLLKRCGESQLPVVNKMGSIDSPLSIITESQ
jgi:hypothetical protein